MLLLSRFKIHGHSMETTLLLGQEVLVSSIPYLFLKPKAGDVVVIINKHRTRHSGERSPAPDGAGQSDSRISCDDGRFWTSLASAEASAKESQNDEGDIYLVKRITKVNQDKYFVEGDNKKDSMDSRRLGWIRRKEIVGKVVYKISNS